MQTIAVQMPAPCPMQCSFCRTPSHGEGDMNAVRNCVLSRLRCGDEVYLTSNGETGLAHGFADFVHELFKLGAVVGVLCATPRSIVSGLVRAEISLNQYTSEMAELAMRKAVELGVPVVLSMVDEGDGFIQQDLSRCAERYGAEAVIVRSLQREGRSLQCVGQTRVWRREGASLGAFPIAAYRELEVVGQRPSVCIDHFGREVEWLGGSVAP